MKSILVVIVGVLAVPFGRAQQPTQSAPRIIGVVMRLTGDWQLAGEPRPLTNGSALPGGSTVIAGANHLTDQFIQISVANGKPATYYCCQDIQLPPNQAAPAVWRELYERYLEWFKRDPARPISELLPPTADPGHGSAVSVAEKSGSVRYTWGATSVVVGKSGASFDSVCQNMSGANALVFGPISEDATIETDRLMRVSCGHYAPLGGGLIGGGKVGASAKARTMAFDPGVYKVFRPSDVVFTLSSESPHQVKDGDQLVFVVSPTTRIPAAKMQVDPALEFGAQVKVVYGADAATQFLVFYLEHAMQTSKGAQ
jgi:hypothetical protein